LKEKETNAYKENLRLNALVGLLDFYSDRAVAHASFLVACVFGLFTILALVQNMEFIPNLLLKIFLILISIASYGGICLIADWCLRKFGSYATAASYYSFLVDEYAEPEKFVMEIEKKGVRRKVTLKQLIDETFDKLRESKRKKIIEKYGLIVEFSIFILPALMVYLTILYKIFST